MTSYFKTGVITHPSPDHSVCEDAVYTNTNPAGLSVVALADGVGSVKFPRETAEEVSAFAGNLLEANFEGLYTAENETGTVWFKNEVYKHMNAYVEEQGESHHRYGSTLICAALHPDGRYLIFHCGDGFAIITKSDGIPLVCSAESKKYVNYTSSVMDPNAEWRCVKGCGDATAILLTSDGIGDDIINNNELKLPAALAVYNAIIKPSSFEQIFVSYTKYCRAKNFRDDISFAWISDRRMVSNVLDTMPKEIRTLIVGGLSNPKTISRLGKIYNLAADCDGIRLNQLTRKLGYRKSAYVRDRLKPFIRRGLLNIDQKGHVRF